MEAWPKTQLLDPVSVTISSISSDTKFLRTLDLLGTLPRPCVRRLGTLMPQATSRATAVSTRFPDAFRDPDFGAIANGMTLGTVPIT